MQHTRQKQISGWRSLLLARCAAAIFGLLVLFAPTSAWAAQAPSGDRPSPPPGVRRTAWNAAPDWRNERVFIGEIVRARLQSVAASSTPSRPSGAGPLPSASRPGTRFAAEVRVVRPLNGGLQPGQTLSLEWPFPQPAAADPRQYEPTTMSQFGVFFLDANGSPLLVRFPGAPAYLGGYFLPLPAETAAMPKQPSAGRSPVEAALVAEVLAAIQFWATAHGPELDEAATRARPGTWYPSVVAGHFQQAISLMAEVDPRPLRQEYTALLQARSPHVRLVGIYGLLQLQDLSALQELERDFASYHRSMRPLKFDQALRVWALSASPRSIDVAGRLALHEDLEPSLESSFAEGLARARVPDTLPYLVTLLGSPHATSRIAALTGLCALTSNKGIHHSGEARNLGRPAMLAPHVPPGAEAFCPQQVPVRDAAQEQEIARYWQNWWSASQEAIASDFRRNERGDILSFPAAPAPSRWLDQTRPVVTLLPGGPRVALRNLLYPFRPNSLGDGDPVPLLKRLLSQGAQASDADWRNCAQILKEHAAVLQSIDEEHMALVRQTMVANAASPGAPPGRQSVEASRARAIEALLNRCLQQMERKLSAKGWHDFQEMLKQRAAQQRQFQTTRPTAPR